MTGMERVFSTREEARMAHATAIHQGIPVGPIQFDVPTGEYLFVQFEKREADQ